MLILLLAVAFPVLPVSGYGSTLGDKLVHLTCLAHHRSCRCRRC